MQAIITKYIGPTNTRGARIAASAAAGRIYLDWDDALNADDNHALAARFFAQKYQWGGKWAHGVLPSGDHVHVNTER